MLVFWKMLQTYDPQRKPVFWYILQSVNILRISQQLKDSIGDQL